MLHFSNANLTWPTPMPPQVCLSPCPTCISCITPHLPMFSQPIGSSRSHELCSDLLFVYWINHVCISGHKVQLWSVGPIYHTLRALSILLCQILIIISAEYECIFQHCKLFNLHPNVISLLAVVHDMCFSTHTKRTDTLCKLLCHTFLMCLRSIC